MINPNDMTEKELGAYIDWLEHPFALEVFFPRLVDQRNRWLENLLAGSEKDENTNIIRGKIRLANQFLALHDDVLKALDESKEHNQESGLDISQSK